MQISTAPAVSNYSIRGVHHPTPNLAWSILGVCSPSCPPSPPQESPVPGWAHKGTQSRGK